MARTRDLERVRAQSGRAYCTAFTAWSRSTTGWRRWTPFKLGDTRTSTPFEIPKRGERLGVGFWGAGRGCLTHHLVLDRGAVANYQIVTPSTWNASPSDRWRHPWPVRGGRPEHPAARGDGRPQAVQGHRHPPGHPQLRPLHAVHDPHSLGRGRHHPRGQHLRVWRATTAASVRVIVGGVGYRNLRDHSVGVEVRTASKRRPGRTTSSWKTSATTRSPSSSALRTSPRSGDSSGPSWSAQSSVTGARRAQSRRIAGTASSRAMKRSSAR